MPVGAFGGRREIMEYLAPVGPVYQAGTLSGNPVAMAAGLAMLEAIQAPDIYPQLNQKAHQLTEGLKLAAQRNAIPLVTTQVGGMFGLFFSSENEIHSFAQVTQCNMAAFRSFFHLMLDEGIYLAPSAYEAGFISLAHGQVEIDATIQAADRAFGKLRNEGFGC